MNKKIGLAICLLSLGSAYASNGSMVLVTDAPLNPMEEIEEIWHHKDLSEKQKVRQVALVLQKRKDESTIVDNSLIAAVTRYESLELFTLLLACKAHPTEKLEKKLDKSNLANISEFLKAIEKQEQHDLLVPALRHLLVGEDKAEVAKMLKELVDGEKLTIEQVFEVLEAVREGKESEETKVSDLSEAFADVIKSDKKRSRRKQSSGVGTLAVGVGIGAVLVGSIWALLLINSDGTE